MQAEHIDRSRSPTNVTQAVQDSLAGQLAGDPRGLKRSRAQRKLRRK